MPKRLVKADAIASDPDILTNEEAKSNENQLDLYKDTI